MADKETTLPKVSFEQRRAAAGQHERAQQVLASGNHDYGIQLLREACKLDPANFVFRQALRAAQRDKYKNNERGQTLGFLRAAPTRLKLQASLKNGNYLQVLEYGEDLLGRNPWDIGAMLAMSVAFEEFDLLQHALWTLDQARHIAPKNIRVNRRLAQILEKRGNFAQAIKLWELVRQANPSDQEAQHKVKDLAASDTIARGRFEETINGEEKTPAGFHVDQPKGEAKSKKSPAAETKETELTAPEMPVAEERGSKDITNILAKIEANPAIAGNYLHIASIYRRNDQIDKARAILQQGLAPTGNNFDIASEIADLDIEPFRKNLAITDSKLERKPDDAELKKMRARLVKEIATRELAYHRQKSERYPTENAHRYEMAVRLLTVGQAEEAIKELQAIRNDPRHRTSSLYYLGFCFKQRNNWRLAQRNFEEALQSLAAGETTMRREILFQLASGLAASGDLARAVDLGCELANLDYSYKDIGKLLDDWQNRMQQA